MNSGNRVSSVIALVFLGALFATDAGRVGEDGTGAMWVAPELLAALDAPKFPGCPREVVIEAADLQTNGRVTFEWHPATGELSFATDTKQSALKPPEVFSAEPFATTLTCESR